MAAASPLLSDTEQHMVSFTSVRHPRKAPELTTGDVLGRIYVASGALQEIVRASFKSLHGEFIV